MKGITASPVELVDCESFETTLASQHFLNLNSIKEETSLHSRQRSLFIL